MTKIKCFTSNLEEATRCIIQLQNATLANEFVVISKANDLAMLLNRERLSAWAMDAFSHGKHLYGGNQINSYTVSVASYPVAQKVGIEYNVSFMANSKGVNDLRCTCAVIARDLLRHVGGQSAGFTRKLSAAQAFFTRQFRYHDSGQAKAHCAVDLLRSGSGVCQAIASMATVILPFMGIPCLYISGEGFSGAEWGPHGWNAVKTPEGNWAMIDFTFGLNSPFFPPSTINHKGYKRFLKNHKWSPERYSDELLENALSITKEITLTRFTLRPGRSMFLMDSISVSAGRHMLQTTDAGYSIDLVFLFRILGGAVEYIPGNDWLHFALYDRDMYVSNASEYISQDGMFDIRILNALPITYSLVERGIEIQLGGTYE